MISSCTLTLRFLFGRIFHSTGFSCTIISQQDPNHLLTHWSSTFERGINDVGSPTSPYQSIAVTVTSESTHFKTWTKNYQLHKPKLSIPCLVKMKHRKQFQWSKKEEKVLSTVKTKKRKASKQAWAAHFLYVWSNILRLKSVVSSPEALWPRYADAIGCVTFDNYTGNLIK